MKLFTTAGRILLTIGKLGVTNIRRIAIETGITYPVVLKHVRVMEEKGIVQTTREKEGKKTRERIVTLTEKGKKLYELLTEGEKIINS